MKKLSLLAVLILAVAAYFVFDLGQYLSLSRLQETVDNNRGLALAVFFLGYVFVAALNLPGVGPLTIASGILFGFYTGVVIVSFASTVGATVSMLISRTLLRDWATNRFSGFLEKVNRGVEKEGATYLFVLRMIPIVPFFVINPVFGLTKMPTWKFYIVSQLGMLPATALYVNIGSSLGAIEAVSFGAVFTPQIIFSFILLALFPFVAKALISRFRTWKLLKKYNKPKQFDNNLVVIGAGAAGLVSSYIAATVKSKVTLIERHAMGGDCLNTGCVPSKALIRAAKAVHHIKDSKKYGVYADEPKVDFQKVMGRVHDVIKQIEPHDSVERYESLGVNCLSGEAEVLSPYEVKVGEQVLTTKKIILAAGARPRVPPIPGLDQINYLTSDTLWALKDLPESLLVLGGGAIGCELSQSFSRLGSNVTMAEMAPTLLPNMNANVGEHMENVLSSEGIQVLTQTKVVEFGKNGDKPFAKVERNGETQEVQFDQVIVAIGRQANTDGPAMKNLDFELNPNGTLAVDEYLQTSIPGIYACGDIAGPYQLTHAAAHQAWYASVNSLFGAFKKFKVNYDQLPAVVFTDPEVAHVGKTEKELQDQSIDYDVTLYELSDLDRAIAEGEDSGFVQVLTPKGKDKILGATIVGSRAGDMLAEFVSAMKAKKGLNSILGTIHSYPTFSEANKFAAGEWKKKNKPEWALNLVESWFKYLRS